MNFYMDLDLVNQLQWPSYILKKELTSAAGENNVAVEILEPLKRAWYYIPSYYVGGNEKDNSI